MRRIRRAVSDACRNMRDLLHRDQGFLSQNNNRTTNVKGKPKMRDEVTHFFISHVHIVRSPAFDQKESGI